MENEGRADGQASSRAEVIEVAGSGSSLLPMLIAGLVMIVVSMALVMIFF